jgi:hypothetical protein
MIVVRPLEFYDPFDNVEAQWFVDLQIYILNFNGLIFHLVIRTIASACAPKAMWDLIGLLSCVLRLNERYKSCFGYAQFILMCSNMEDLHV